MIITTYNATYNIRKCSNSFSSFLICSASIGSTSGCVLWPRPQLHWLSGSLHKDGLCPWLQLPCQLWALHLSSGHLVHLTHHIVVDLLAHHRVALVLRVAGDELTHPGGGSQQFSWERGRRGKEGEGAKSTKGSKVSSAVLCVSHTILSVLVLSYGLYTLWLLYVTKFCFWNIFQVCVKMEVKNFRV